jgi:ribulose-phosphate 3-epimerase
MMEGGAAWIHMDVMDGQFVPPITFGASMVSSLLGCGPVPFEAHLMTLTPEAHFDSFIAAGCKRIIFHQEVAPHAHRFIQALHEKGVEAGIAINPATPVCSIQPVLPDVDMVLVMTVNPGWGGQSLIRSCLDKVREIRKHYPALTIEVDGGIDSSTILEAKEAGANLFVCGNGLTKQSTVKSGVEHLRSLLQ